MDGKRHENIYCCCSNVSQSFACDSPRLLELLGTRSDSEHFRNCGDAPQAAQQRVSKSWACWWSRSKTAEQVKLLLKKTEDLAVINHTSYICFFYQKENQSNAYVHVCFCFSRCVCSGVCISVCVPLFLGKPSVLCKCCETAAETQIKRDTNS